MRSARAVLGLVTVAALSGLVHPHLHMAQAALGPAYDVSTQISMRDLRLALHSYAVAEGGLEDVTVAELADWGWVPSESAAVVIAVDGRDFQITSRDVRPGARAFVVESDGWVWAAPSAPPPVPGVTIQVVRP